MPWSRQTDSYISTADRRYGCVPLSLHTHKAPLHYRATGFRGLWSRHRTTGAYLPAWRGWEWVSSSPPANAFPVCWAWSCAAMSECILKWRDDKALPFLRHIPMPCLHRNQEYRKCNPLPKYRFVPSSIRKRNVRLPHSFPHNRKWGNRNKPTGKSISASPHRACASALLHRHAGGQFRPDPNSGLPRNPDSGNCSTRWWPHKRRLSYRWQQEYAPNGRVRR